MSETPHEHRIKFLKEELELFKKRKVKKVLEVCSGDDDNIPKLLSRGYEISELKEEEVFGRKFPFKNEEFDCVYSYQYINHNYKEEIEKVFKEIFRVLKKKGIFSLKTSDMGQFNLKQIEDSIYEECDPEFPKIKYRKLAEQTFEKLEGDEKGILHYAFYENELKDSLKKIGFKIINFRKIRWNLVGNFTK